MRNWESLVSTVHVHAHCSAFRAPAQAVLQPSGVRAILPNPTEQGRPSIERNERLLPYLPAKGDRLLPERRGLPVQAV